MVSEKVLTEEDKQLRDYELVMVISPAVLEEAFETVIGNVSKLITDKGGVISNIDRWGKKKLAYPIKHFGEGSYVLTRFKFKPVLGKELESNLRISEEILRFLLVRLDS
ncbi:MAG: 30S ribosomal protein S6 [Chloroflexi bacterium]|nr:30S ribosomal protein S6 [Chloroflexota bacterium]